MPEFACWFLAIAVLGATNPVIGIIVLVAGIIRLGFYGAKRQ